MLKAVYPGSFDPITNGHLNIIKRANKLVDQLIIAVCVKKNHKTYFKAQERKKMIEANIPEEIIVKLCSSSLVDFIERVDANLIIRGLRSISDFELEFQKALMNKKMNKEVETILLASEPEFNYLTSNAVMEVSEFKNEVKKFVPKNVQERIETKLN